MSGQWSKEAERIVEEKPAGWEYRLTAEVLRTELAPVLQRWDALKRGLYSKQTTRVAKRDCIEWMQDRLSEVERMAAAFTSLVNSEFARAWGEPGEPGDSGAITSACQLLAELCVSALTWEETVRFAVVDPIFEQVRALFVGVAGRFIDEVPKIPAFISGILDDENATGTHKLDLVLTLPDGWNDQLTEALDDVTESLIANPGD